MNACANEPNPPRVTPLEPESDDVPDEEWLDESPLKKLLRDDDPPDEPWLLLDEAPRGGHSAWVCSPDGVAIPGRIAAGLRAPNSVFGFSAISFSDYVSRSSRRR